MLTVVLSLYYSRVELNLTSTFTCTVAVSVSPLGSHLDLSVAHGERALLDAPPGVPLLCARVAGHQQEVAAVNVDGLAALEVLPRHAAHSLTLRREARWGVGYREGV